MDRRGDYAWILKVLEEKPWKTRKGIADAIGVPQSAITEMLKGRRKIYVGEVPKIAAYLEVRPPSMMPAFVPLRGYVGAGSEAHLFSVADDPNEEVEAPEGATADTVAVEIRGESLGALFDRWLVYYDDVHNPPTSDMIGRLCVVGLSDGRVLVKQLMRSGVEGYFKLLSNFEAPIHDVAVEWAARVKQMTPR